MVVCTFAGDFGHGVGEEEEKEDGEKYNGDAIPVCSVVAEC